MATINKLSAKLDKVLTLPDDFEKGMSATSTLHQKASEIRSEHINWKAYQNGLMISQEEHDFITHFEKMDSASREMYLSDARNRLETAKMFLNLLGHIPKEQIVQYILILIDDMLNEQKGRVEIFKEHATKKKESIWGPFFGMLVRDDSFIQNMAARIIAKIACWGSDQMEGQDLNYYIKWLRDQLYPENRDEHPQHYIQNTARCLQMMLRIEPYRTAFVESDGIRSVVNVLSGKSSFQIQYQLTFCLWIITFNVDLIERIKSYNIIPILADILSETGKEKVTRIVLATFRNLLEKPEDPDTIKDNAITMVHCKVPKQLEILLQSGSKYEDEDLKEDIDYITEKLHNYVLDLSSFDEYSNELRSGRLEWSPVHSNENFWRENAHRLNERNYELLKILVKLLETSKDNLVLSVAAHDIGEYVRHYPRGKTVAENLGAKQLVMQLLTHVEPHVKYEALLCLQKMMVHNWEYLGKKLESETGMQKDGKPAAARA